MLIRNKLNQRLIINLIGGRNIDLLAKGTANISDEEFCSPHLQTLITQGDIVVIATETSKESKAEESEKVRPPGEEVSAESPKKSEIGEVEVVKPPKVETKPKRKK